MNRSAFVGALIIAILSTTAYAQRASKESNCANLGEQVQRERIDVAGEQIDLQSSGIYEGKQRHVMQLAERKSQLKALERQYKNMGCDAVGVGYSRSPFTSTDEEE